MGGREAMMVTQRLPKRSTASWSVTLGSGSLRCSPTPSTTPRFWAALASSMGIFSRNGLPLVNNTYTNQDLQLISKAVLDACDALDGLADGIVNKPLQCTIDARLPQAGRSAVQWHENGDLSDREPDQHHQEDLRRADHAERREAVLSHGCGIRASLVARARSDCNTPTATNISTGWRSWKLRQRRRKSGNLREQRARTSRPAAEVPQRTVIVPTPPILPANVNNEGTTAMLMGFNLDQWIALSHGTTAEVPGIRL